MVLEGGSIPPSLTTMAHPKYVTVKLNGFNFDKVEFKELTVLVGPNGSGKSFLNKLFYFHLKFLKLLQSSIDSFEEQKNNINELAQYVLDNVFIEPDFTGILEVESEKEQKVKYTFDNGKIIVNELDNSLLIDDIPEMLYQSADSRLFNFLVSYLEANKILNDSIYNIQTQNSLNDEEKGQKVIDEITKFRSKYRLYDHDYAFLWMNNNNYNIPEETRVKLHSFIPHLENIKSIKVDNDNAKVFIVFKNNTEKNVLTFSNGEQSLINMIVSTSMVANS
jgi:hypothetical protein